jgi:uncharacterized protein YwgA
MDTTLGIADLTLRFGTMEGRKRMQKVVYLLQEAGIPFTESFEFGHFGPYSRTLTDEINWLVAGGMLDEKPKTTRSGEVMYCYEVPDEIRERLLALPAGVRLPEDKHTNDLIAILKQASTPVLEVASAMRFLHRLGMQGKAFDDTLQAWKPTLGDMNEPAKALLVSLELAPGQPTA